MLFHTWSFFIFFAVVYLLYLPLRSTPYWRHWLLASSYFFYGWWNPLYLALILFCTASNYLAVRRMRRGGGRRACLWIAVFNSLSVLFFFKYANFLIDTFNAVFEMLPGIAPVASFPFLLPVGISFFTFQAMSYTIDCHRGEIDGEAGFIQFATFVALFPQLVAGPIERAGTLLPQLAGKPRIRRENITDGLSLFVTGLFKKVALADYLALYVDSVYAAPQFHDGAALLTATFAFGWQIYFDFSGYTDMARGIARMMGFRLMLNFNNPYLATDLGDFWQRWHISLSTWFRDYVYIPLGGNRKGSVRTYVNIFLTMVLSGLWHGAAWTFVLWGALHAVGRMVTRPLERSSWYRDKLPRPLKQLLVFTFVTFCWIFFRAESWPDAVLILRRMFTAGYSRPDFPGLALGMCLAVWGYQFLCESRMRRMLETPVFKVGAVAAMILYLLVGAVGHHEAFIYFQF